MVTSNPPKPNIFPMLNTISVDVDGLYVHLYHTRYTGARSMSVMAHPLLWPTHASRLAEIR